LIGAPTSKAKRPKEIGRTPDLKYYWYHKVVSHPLEKYIILKERIMQIAKDERVILNLDDIVKTKHVSSQLECFSLPSQQNYFAGLIFLLW